MKKKVSKLEDDIVIEEENEDDELDKLDNMKDGMFTIEINGEIGWDVTASSIKDQLLKADGQDIIIEIASPGGSVFEGIEIFNAIRDYNGKTESRIKGMAASMASYIPLAADKVLAEDNSTYMIHNAWGVAMGDSEEMRDQADILESINKTIAQEYVKKTGKSVKEILKMMDEETWLFGDEIKEYKFVDDLIVHDKDSSDKNKKSKDQAITESKDKFKSTLSKTKEDKMKSDIEKLKNKFNVVKDKKICKFTKWSRKYKSELPDSAFALVKGEGKDKVRLFPYIDIEGKIDVPHLRNALVRLSNGNTNLEHSDRFLAIQNLKGSAEKYMSCTKTKSSKIIRNAISKFEADIKDKLSVIVDFLKSKATNRKPNDELSFSVKKIGFLIQDLEDCISIENSRKEIIEDNKDEDNQEDTMVKPDKKEDVNIDKPEPVKTDTVIETISKEKTEDVKKTDLEDKSDKVIEADTKTKKVEDIEEDSHTEEDSSEDEEEVIPVRSKTTEKPVETDNDGESTESDDDEDDIEQSKFQELLSVCDGFKSELDKNTTLISKFESEIKSLKTDKDKLHQELSKFKEEKYTKLLNSTVEKVSKFKGLNDTDKLKLKQEYLVSKMSDSALEEIGRITDEEMFSKLEEPKETTKPSSQLGVITEPVKEFSKMSKSEQLDRLANIQAKQKGFVVR